MNSPKKLLKNPVQSIPSDASGATSTLQYAELNGKTDRNVRGVRETAIKQIRKKYKTALETRLLHLPWTLTLDEKYFFENGARTKDEKNSEKQ